MGAGRDVSGRHRDGREVPIAISLSPLATADGTVVLGAITDITELRLAQERLRALNETLEQRVAERTALAERRARELAESNAQLARSNRDLDDFAYIASHDLKEPLRGIVNYATFLMEDHGGALASDARERLETIMRLSGRLGSLIDGLLQFSRVGRLDLAVGEADLNALVREAAEALQGTLEEQRAEVRVPAPLPTVRCDRLRTRELFYNLISNAVKYNDKPRKWVEIGVAEPPPGGEGTNGDRAAPTVFYVRDNGIGIPRKHQEAIFRIFKRLHGREKFGGGTGAGLTIAQKIVERHGGRIWCESTEGEGATFYFTLEGGENAGAHEAAAPDPGGRG
jgi:chemotaxis family two-component system sensor kinase Cph1